jgi:hypothetical protein
MAVPQLVLAGNNNLPMLKDAFSQQDQHGDLLASLVNLTKELVDGQAELFQKLLLVMDTKSEDTSVASASGSVEGIEEEMTLGVKDLFAGAFIALTLWSNELDKYIRTIFLVKALDNLTGLSTKIGNVFKAIGDVWSKKTTTQFLKGDTYKTLGKLTAPIRAIADFFGRILKFLKPVIDTVKGVGSKIGKITKPIMGLFNSLSGLGGIGKTIGPFVKMAEKFAPLAKGILSKVLLPLFAIFDFVSGFIEGFSSKGEDDSRGMLEKIFDGMVQGAVEVIRGIFIIPLDLLKSGLSWLLGKLGFSEAEKLLDSFSFNEMYDKMIAIYKNFFSTEPEEGYFSIVKFIMDSIDGMIKYVKGLLDMNPADALKKLAGDALDIITAPHRWIWNNAIKPAIDSIIKMFGGSAELPDTGEIGDMATNFLKNLLRSVLPNPDAGFIQNLGSKAIPNSVYEFAGLDPKTGKELPAAIADTSQIKPTGAQLAAAIADTSQIKPTGAQLAADTQDVATKKEEQNKGQAAPVIVSAGNSGDTNVYGGGTTILGPSLRSIPDQNWMYGGA